MYRKRTRVVAEEETMAEDKDTGKAGKKIVYRDPTTQELPPPGDARNEELKKREDTLEQKAEELADQNEVYAIDPKALKIENELAQHFDYQEGTMLVVTNPQPGRVYNWANHASQHGIDVTRKMAQGWQVVKSEDPECEHMRGADGTRRIGDLMLLWTTPEQKARLDAYETGRRDRIYGPSGTVEQEMRDLSAKHPNSFVVRPAQRTSRVGTAAELLGPKHVSPGMRETAARMLGEKLRNEVPGLPIPGKR